MFIESLEFEVSNIFLAILVAELIDCIPLLLRVLDKFISSELYSLNCLVSVNDTTLSRLVLSSAKSLLFLFKYD